MDFIFFVFHFIEIFLNLVMKNLEEVVLILGEVIGYSFYESRRNLDDF